MADLIGKTLGAYRIESRLGMGGMGEVYLATHTFLNRSAAIKVLHANQAADPTFQARFLREARAAAALSHPNIVEVFDFGEQDGASYLVMELVPDGSLRTLLRQRAATQGWTLGLGVELVRQAAEGLAYAHARGMVHRDIKPDNLLLQRHSRLATADGGQAPGHAEQFTLKISDFGLARLIEDNSELTATGMVMGTPAYMSPEQCQGAELDGRSDLYSLGVVLYEVATGALPFRAKTLSEAVFKHISAAPTPPRELRPDLPIALEDVIMRCLQKRPDDRFATGSALAEALDGALGDTEVRTIITTRDIGGLLTPNSSAPSNAATPSNVATPSNATAHPIGPPSVEGGEANANMTVRATPAGVTPLVPAATALDAGKPKLAAATATQWTPADHELATVASGPAQLGKASSTLTQPKVLQPKVLAAGAGALALVTILIIALVTRSPASGKIVSNSVNGGNGVAATATKAPSPTATPVEIVAYQNSLNTSSSSWPRSSHSFFSDGGYELNGAWIAFAPVKSFSNGSISVRMRQLSGPADQFYGIMFRSPGSNDYYLFGISQNQQWMFSLVLHGNGSPLTPATTNTHINAGLNVSNTLEVRASGGHFDFYINGVQVGQKDDSTLTTGQVGLINAVGHLVVVYNDFTVKTPA